MRFIAALFVVLSYLIGVCVGMTKAAAPFTNQESYLQGHRAMAVECSSYLAEASMKLGKIQDKATTLVEALKESKQ